MNGKQPVYDAVVGPGNLEAQAAFLSKILDNTATFEECQENLPILEEEGYAEITSDLPIDPRARGAEGRVQEFKFQSSYDLTDFKKGRVILEPKNRRGMAIIEGTAEDGTRLTGTFAEPVWRLLKPELWKRLPTQ
ncbi:hypothetical protein ACFL13_00250 [Patescibacteria group bacterium]